MPQHERKPISEPEGFVAWAAKVLNLPHRSPPAEHLVLRAAADELAWRQASEEVDPRWIVFRPWREAYEALVRSWGDGTVDLRREQDLIRSRHALEPVKAEEMDNLGQSIVDLRRLHALSEARMLAIRVMHAAMAAETAEAFFVALQKEGKEFKAFLTATSTRSAPPPSCLPSASSGSPTGPAGSPTR